MRPLKFDPEFQEIINKNLYSKFLIIFNIRVPDTFLYKKLSLQKGLIIISIIDIIFGIFFYFFHKVNSILDKLIYYSPFFFGLIALHTSLNLKSNFSMIYYYYRIILIFFIPINEYFFYIRKNYCYIEKNYCNFFIFFIFSILIIILLFYFAKISWAFYVHLLEGNYLIIIYGNYLKTLLINENLRIEMMKMYKPPKIKKNIIENKTNFEIKKNENEEKNPFKIAMKMIKQNEEKK